jgi:hypothetical protein
VISHQKITHAEKPACLIAAMAIGVLGGAVVLWQSGAGTPQENDAEQLIASAAHGDLAGMRAFLAADAQVRGARLKRENLERALHFATMFGQIEVVEDLLSRGVDPNARVQGGITPLMLTVEGQNGPEIASRLLAAGASVNAVDSEGKTTLMDAIAAHKTSLVRLLLDAGADARIGTERENETSCAKSSFEGRIDSGQ